MDIMYNKCVPQKYVCFHQSGWDFFDDTVLSAKETFASSKKIPDEDCTKFVPYSMVSEYGDQ